MKKLLLIAFVIFSANAFAQQSSKLSTAIKYILQHPINAENETTYPELFKSAFGKATNPITNQLEDGLFCIIRTTNAQALKDNGIQVYSELPKFVTAFVKMNQMASIVDIASVTYIDVPKVIYPTNDLGIANAGANLLYAGKLNNTNYFGDGVLVGVFDTGIDWDHPDFRNATDQTKSRILKLWDQTITPISGEASPSGFGYGVEYSQAHINDELDGTPTGYVRERDINGHGTHVAGTCAGNGAALATKKNAGVAPNAEFIIVKGGNGSFSSTNEINAMTYFKNVATALGKPIVVNMSIGGQSGAHDGTNDDEIAVDNFSNSAAGRVVCISAGNDNGKAIHRQVSLNAAANGTYVVNVPTASGTSDVNVFQISIYVNNTNNVDAVVTLPNASTITANAGQSISPSILSGAATAYLDNTIDFESGDRLINLYVVRSSGSANPSGTYTITLTNSSASAVRLDGWLNYSGSNFANTLTSGDNNYLVGSPGNATTAITVASHVGRLDWHQVSTTPGGVGYGSPTQQDAISTFSSRGPRRDDVQKPNISASGQAVISCLSSDAGLAASSTFLTTVGLYRANQGTSMSSPMTAGCIALMLQVKPSATFTQIRNAIQNTATKDVFTGNTPNYIFGYGKIDVFKAASSLVTCTTFSRETYSYDSSTISSNTTTTTIASNNKAAVRFTPTLTGKLGGVYVKVGNTIPTNNFTIQVFASDGSNPATSLGSLSITPNTINKYGWNYFDITSLEISCTTGVDYFIAVYSSDSYSLGTENLQVSNRSKLFNGSSWNNVSTDYRIRSVVYNNDIPSTSSTTSITACNSYTWNGVTYNTSGTYTFNSTNSIGCDSIATLELTINSSSSSTTNITACNSYLWNGATYTTSGTYTYNTTNSVGCDSIATLNLTINASSSTSTNHVACNSYTWNGITYTTSGTYNYVTTNAKGCDSVATLILTINNSTSSTTIITACNSYVWNGTTYNMSGTYTKSFTNAKGCDSTATLNLTINLSTQSTTNITATSSYTWNGVTYYTSGTYIKTSLTNSKGCDSTATIVLIINNVFVPIISGPNSVCVGSNITLTTNLGGGGIWSNNGRVTVSSLGLVTGTSGGTTAVKYTLGAQVANFNLTVYVLPAIPTIAYAIGTANPQLGCPAGTYGKNRTFTLMGIPSGGVWNTTGQLNITNAGVATTSNTNGAGSVTYTYTNSNGCSQSRTITGAVGNCVSKGINGQESTAYSQQILIYPNPAKSLVNIKIDYLIGKGEVFILDNIGKVVKQQNIGIGVNTIDVANLSKGIYFVNIISAHGKKVKKLMVE